MKKLLTLLVTAVLAVTAVFGLTACNKASTVDVTTKTITVGYTDYAPMNYTEDNVFMGFDTELSLMVFNALGYDVRFKLIEWSNKYVELNEGTIDCIWNGFTSNGEDDGKARNTLVDFSYNYMQNAQCILKSKTAPAITSASDLANKSVAFENGSGGESLADSYAKNVTLMKVGCTNQMEAVTKLNQGAADYAIVDIILAQTIIAQTEYSNLEINTGIEIPVEYYAIGFKLDSELTAKVNVMLEAFAKTGQLQELANKYNVGTMVITDFSSQK
ncbi:MAG: transporter substrate-binding domain-containing protein [Clostridia bacterium]|nr:transporter substrate-binding domain-containing protein [Clostridia bacterium]